MPLATNALPTQLIPGAEPFRFEAPGDLACLLVHGFTGSPHELRELGRHLAEQGITAQGVLLPGHGTSPEDMASCRYQDWLAAVERELDALLAEGKRVVLAGLSMGGTLALNVAARRAEDARLAGVVALAAPLRFVDWRLRLLPVAGLLMRWLSWGRPDIKDASVWDQHVAYRRFHVRALIQLVRLVRDTRLLARQVRQPLLVVQSRLDNTVAAFNAQLICQTVASPAPRLVWLDNSYHVITLDYDAARVRQEVAGFIREITSSCDS